MELVLYPAEVLGRRAALVPDPATVAVYAREMVRLMREQNGIGLAAPQVGLSMRFFVLGVDRGHEQVFVNPQIVRKSRRRVRSEESCLSLPDVTVEVPRAAVIDVRAWGENGEPFEMRARGLSARAIQHELDHLNGVLCIDRIDTKRRERIARRMEALDRDGTATRSAP